MKPLNTTKFITNMTAEINDYKLAIKSAESYESARQQANRMLGYISCACTFLNTMLCTENNDFTAEFDEVLNDWEGSLYSLLADKAIETHQNPETTSKLIRLCFEVTE